MPVPLSSWKPESQLFVYLALDWGLSKKGKEKAETMDDLLSFSEENKVKKHS